MAHRFFIPNSFKIIERSRAWRNVIRELKARKYEIKIPLDSLA